MNYLAVAAGGALGSIGRYWMTLMLGKYSAQLKSAYWLPLGTLLVNVLGSFLIGIVWFYLQQRNHNEWLRLFVAMGMLGGFTTFSTFSLETIQLLGSGEMARAAINVMLNVFICLMAAASGVAIGRYLFY